MAFKTRALIEDRVDLVSTASTRDASRDLIRRSISPDIRELVPHVGNLEEISGI